uniref:Uncharacterized protein n=1 Tax=Panagrolaimus sp. PS1159 TaxID=55785 RepID=A0AC35GKF7_9BILA
MNGIYHVNFSSAKKILSLNLNNVVIYDDENLTIFPASIDYGFSDKKVGIECNSPTVIKEVMKYFGEMSAGNVIPLREIYSLTKIKRYYVLKVGHNERLIEEGRVIVDLIDEAINRSELSKDSITLVIPFNFSEIQRENYLKVTEVAGLTNISFIDEQTA